MLFDDGNPYKNGLPKIITLSDRDFHCDISEVNLDATGHNSAWTVLVFMGADNNLAANMFDDLIEMKKVGSDENINIVAFFMGPLLTDSFLARLNKGTKLEEDIIYRWYNMRANDPKVLELAIELTSALYPAKNNFIIISGHGNGWLGALEDEGIGRTYEKNGLVSKPPLDVFSTYKKCYDQINSKIHKKQEPKDKPELRYGLLAFDACYMGNMEAIDYFKDIADIIISSEDKMPGSGYPYHEVLNLLKGSPTITYKDLAKGVISKVHEYYRNSVQQSNSTVITQTALDSSKLIPFCNYSATQSKPYFSSETS